MSSDQFPKQLDSIAPNVAALVLEAPCCQLSSLLAPLRKLLLQVADTHEDLNGSAPTVGIDVKKAFLQNVEETIDLHLGVLAPFLLTAKLSNHVATDLNNGTSKTVDL